MNKTMHLHHHAKDDGSVAFCGRFIEGTNVTMIPRQVGCGGCQWGFTLFTGEQTGLPVKSWDVLLATLNEQFEETGKEFALTGLHAGEEWE